MIFIRTIAIMITFTFEVIILFFIFPILLLGMLLGGTISFIYIPLLFLLSFVGVDISYRIFEEGDLETLAILYFIIGYILVHIYYYKSYKIFNKDERQEFWISHFPYTKQIYKKLK